MKKRGCISWLSVSVCLIGVLAGINQQTGRLECRYFATGSVMDNGTGLRVDYRRVNFVSPFAEIPRIHIGIAAIDANYGRNLRFDVLAGDINRNGFSVYVRTWGDSIIHQVDASWIAYSHE